LPLNAHGAAVGLYHATSGTRAMAAGLADHVWEIEELVGLID
jgi:hypothetical protein